MNRAICNAMAVALFVALVSIESLDAQQRERQAEPSGALLSKLQGSWSPIGVQINGPASRASLYGPSIFAGNTWTMQTTSGDHAFELSAINEQAEPMEVTFVDKVANRSFVGLLSLEDETLTIAGGTDATRNDEGRAHIPRPDSLAPGPNKIVYTWKRSPAAADLAARPSLTVRLFDDGDPERVLANHTIQTFFGGKFEYVSGGADATAIPARTQAFGRQADNAFALGTRITGSVKEAADGAMRVVVEIHLGNTVSTEEPETRIVRSESLMLQTILKPKEKKRIDCGGNRRCELVLE